MAAAAPTAHHLTPTWPTARSENNVSDVSSPTPGQSVRIETGTRSGLKTLLTQRKFVPDDKTGTYYEEATAYDQSSVDVPYIVRAMMFFQAAYFSAGSLS